MIQDICRVDKEPCKNLKRQGKGMEEQTGLSDKTVQRLREYLLGKGWTAEQILDLLDYITK